MQTITLRTAQVAIVEDDTRLVTPEPGDPVTLTVEGRIVSVQGDRVTVALENANGEPLPSSNEAGGEPDLDDEGESLRQMMLQNRRD